MADDGPRVILDVGAPSGGSVVEGQGLDTTTVLALVAFVGTVFFCTCQALIAPRRTFCAQKMD